MQIAWRAALRRGAGLVAVAALGLAPGMPAAGPAETIAEASARITDAASALDAAPDLPPEDRIAALTDAIGAYGQALDTLRGVVLDATAREREIAVTLALRREQIARLLGALQKMERAPPPARGLHPQGPLAAARAAGMMERLRPALQDAARGVAGALGDLEAARLLRDAGKRDLAAGLVELDAARDELRGELEPHAAPRITEDAALAGMLRDTDTLTALAAALAEPVGAQPAGPRAARALSLPVAGEVLLGFNAPDAAGVRRPGIVLRAAPLSLVTAPAPGVVRYAGPFLDYGYVVVLEADAQTLVVVAGLAQLRIRSGDTVRQGALLGLLGGRALDVEEYLMLPRAGTGAGMGETLYIEIRHGRSPVDPEPWFARGNG